MTARKRIWVGAPGWHYAHWRGPFFPENMKSSEMPAFYTERFQTVEINNSFYHLPSRETFRHWRAQSPAPRLSIELSLAG